MSYDLRRVQDANVKDKRVLLRLDLDIPLNEQLSPVSNKVVARDYDYFRLDASKDTIEYLIKHGAKIIIIGHMGRPSGKEMEFSLGKIVPWFLSNYGGEKKETSLGEFNGWKINESITLLENLRFYKGEEESSKDFSKSLASLADIFINDSFAAIHRDHASVVGVAKILPSYAGLNLQKEVKVLSGVLNSPQRPLAVVVGGSKIETKLPLVERMHAFADCVLVGGEIAENTKVLLKVAHQKSRRNSLLLIADLNSDGDDITPVSFANFAQALRSAKTIVWNGPMGKISSSKNRVFPSEAGTLEIARLIASSTAFTVVGGGDTTAFLLKNNLIDKYDFVSSGGGAMLEFLSGEPIEGLRLLES